MASMFAIMQLVVYHACRLPLLLRVSPLSSKVMGKDTQQTKRAEALQACWHCSGREEAVLFKTAHEAAPSDRPAHVS